MPADPAAIGVQVPTEDAASHRSQPPVQAAEQQTPEAQKPVTQSDTVAQVCPDFFLQAPVASQLMTPVHVSGSSAPFTGAHAPVPATHFVQVAGAQAVVQQTPSLQEPDAQSLLATHASPGANAGGV